jgi:hypothetical protein
LDNVDPASDSEWDPYEDDTLDQDGTFYQYGTLDEDNIVDVDCTIVKYAENHHVHTAQAQRAADYDRQVLHVVTISHLSEYEALLRTCNSTSAWERGQEELVKAVLVKYVHFIEEHKLPLRTPVVLEGIMQDQTKQVVQDVLGGRNMEKVLSSFYGQFHTVYPRIEHVVDDGKGGLAVSSKMVGIVKQIIELEYTLNQGLLPATHDSSEDASSTVAEGAKADESDPEPSEDEEPDHTAGNWEDIYATDEESSAAQDLPITCMHCAST